MKPKSVLIIGSLYPPQRLSSTGTLIGVANGSVSEAKKAELEAAQLSAKEARKAADDQKLEDAKKVFAEQEPQFHAACKALGAAFARNHWQIMVGVPDWKLLPGGHTVATHVIQGASGESPDEKTPKHKIVFYGPRDPEPADKTPEVADTLQELQDLPNIELEHKLIAKGEYKAKLIPNVTEVDAVLLVAGSDGTASIGYAAHSMARPVIAITGFGGAAKSLHEDVLEDAYDRYKDAVDLTDKELWALNASWKPDSADKANRGNADQVVHATEKLVKAYGQASTKTTRVLGWSMLVMALLLVFWVAVYLWGATIAKGSAPNAAAIAAPATRKGDVPTPTAAKAEVGAQVAAKSDAATPTAAKSEFAATGAEKADAVAAPMAAKGEVATASPKGDATPAGSAKSAAAVPATGKGDSPPPTGVVGKDNELNRSGGATKQWTWFLPVAFFLLLYISAAVGTGLRVLVSYQSNQITRLTPFAVLIEVVIALSLAFGLGLFYLIGGISFTGQVVALEPGSNTFATIAVSMSLLGLAAGYLVPLDKLHDRLQKIFAEEKK